MGINIILQVNKELIVNIVIPGLVSMIMKCHILTIMPYYHKYQ